VTAAREPRAAGFFVLRTPLLPLTAVTDWARGLEAAGRLDEPDFEDALAADRAQLRARLDGLVTDAAFREALFLAAPTLAAATDQWRKDPDSDRGKRAENSLVAYLMRAAARPTPFGLFAGCTTGSIGQATRLRLAGRESYRRHTRLDMDFLWTLAKAIEADPELRAGLRYRPNSSLYQVGDRLLYAEARDIQTGRAYHLVAVDHTPYLAKVLASAAAGAGLDELAAVLIDPGPADEEVTDEEARAYLAQLIDSQLLVADCQPPVTGSRPAGALAAVLAPHPATAGIAARLRQAESTLQDVDASGCGAPPDRYRELAASLSDLPAAPDPARFVQVDLLVRASAAELGPAVAAELLTATRLLHALAPPRGADALAGFREQFDRRYGTRELPLAQVLDEESGIGYAVTGQQQAGDGGPLLAGLPLAPRQHQQAAWTPRDAFLQRKLAVALAAGRPEIAVSQVETGPLRDPDQLPLPDAFEVVATIAAESDEALGRGDYQLFVGSVGGPSGARLLGRFCHADDELHDRVRAHLRTEEQARPGCVFAEVVHLPQGRTGNILSRPVLRDYEIPYLGRSGAPADRQLPLSDLLVSVQNERVLLRSRRLGCEVVPRLTSAHNYAAGGLGVYRFLCALQQQHVLPGVMWDWGPVRTAPFLPRVVSGRAVLSRMTWNLDPEELAAFAQPAGPGQFRAVQQLRARRCLPRYVALADADNELLADLDNVLSVEALAHQVRRRPAASLVELWPAPDRLCVTGPQGSFTHQVVVPFERPGADAAAPRPAELTGPASRPAGSAVRQYPPGSPWLYLKLFAGPATADRILLRVAPAILRWRAAGVIDSWHFVRYGDPDWHLRLRLHGAPGVLLTEVLPRLEQLTSPLLATGELWRTQLDTYEPEVERYGGDLAIAAAERVFHADSEAALAIIGRLPGDAGADLRWQLALRGIDRLLDDLGLGLADKRDLARRCKAGYGREFGADGAFQHAVGARFRRYRPRLADLLGDPAGAPADVAACGPALAARSAAIAGPCAELRALAGVAGQPPAALSELAMSLAHMHVNRLLRSAQRAQELVLYELLDRIYASRSARAAR
jgi:thiopeptide-type bacteriocin biosynthesis protein